MLVGVLRHCVCTRVVVTKAVTGFKMASTEGLAAGKKAAAVAAVDELVKVFLFVVLPISLKPHDTCVYTVPCTCCRWKMKYQWCRASQYYIIPDIYQYC